MLKVSGGVLSAGAGYYAAMQDWDKVKSQREKGHYAIAWAYRMKSATQFGSATLGLLASVSYAAPLMQASGSQAVKWIGGRLLFYRLFCMTWAVRLNLVGLAITFLVWVFVDDALQDWCQESPFGKQASKGPQDPKKLMDELGKALEEIA